MTRKRLGFFTRLLDDATPKERYRLATEQIRHAERHGFDSAWIAQHHFHENEGGLPSPLLFLAHVAAHTETIRLGTAIITRWTSRSRFWFGRHADLFPAVRTDV